MSYHSPRQALRSAVMSAAVALQGVTVEAPGEMRRDVGSDLVFYFIGSRWFQVAQHLIAKIDERKSEESEDN